MAIKCIQDLRVDSRSQHITTQCDQCYCSSVATFGSCVCQARNDTSGDSRVEHMLYTQEYDCHEFVTRGLEMMDKGERTCKV